MDELPIGRRVAYWRGRRNLSQQVFADLLGKSKSWVDKIERGVRRLDKFSVVSEIADVLHVDVKLLHDPGPPRERQAGGGGGIDQADLEEMRAALARYDQMNAFFPLPGVQALAHRSDNPPPLSDLQKATGHAWLTYQHARYGVLARTLPKLVRDAQAADAAYACTTEGDACAHLLGQIYQIGSSMLRKLGDHALAWLAADRAVAVAQRAGDPLLAGTAAARTGAALAALGRPRPALEVHLNVANRLAPVGSGEVASPQLLSVYGLLLMKAAMAAARIGDSASVRDLLDGAADAASKVGADQNHYWTCFGPTNVTLHRAAGAVELGDGRSAVAMHTALDRSAFNALPPERRGHHYLDMARGYLQIGNTGMAAEMLLEGDRVAPAEIRCRPIGHEVLSEVLRRTRGTPPQPVLDLAEHIGARV